ncbi:penicillin-binding protein 2 [Aestuariicella hydrocarbonica]|uniref:Peptidoglycan D,D-transpeptidase MrdA n=1 Tax=Pseudomaricurvus hydrocarbonicus TaxID=1470433 RepID=A0A9E5JRT5_9GAMM|nr:penicillin-binding protein 2 [Aestuariicella hydrocarbonica]NHO64363.1 penicillin-binding protein 2 [Aestuariicella hydrocarbonica]
MPEQQHLKDHYQEARIFARRMVVAALAIVMLLGVLLARLYNLQVVNYQDYVTQSDRNRVQVQPLPPTRGLIYDRQGRLLADNRPSYNLTLIKEQITDLPATLELLGQLVDLKEGDVEEFEKRLKQRRRPFEAVPLSYRLTEEEIARLAVNEYRLPGVKVSAQLVRDYPMKSLLAHTVGYVGRINDRELAAFDEQEYRLYSGTHTVGKVGLEREYESTLLGEVGYQYVETNARGRVLRVLESIAPVPGKNLQLYLDIDIQREAIEALGDYRGAVVALDVKTGGVLAMASTPSYDPNLFVTGISYKDYRALNESLDLPLYNRAIQGQYPPGSTVKPMLGLAALHNGVVTPESFVRDPGFYQIEGEKRLYRDWKRQGHGRHVDLLQAVTESCDTYFYDTAYRMGIDAIHEFGSHFALGERTGIDIPSERRGIWPSKQWKREARGRAWYPGDTVNVGIGQGAVLTTPLQMAAMTATIASRGRFIEPHLVHTMGEEKVPSSINELSTVSQKNWDFIFATMKNVVHGVRGTAKSISTGLTYHMAGKTGTAQVVGIAQGEKYDSEALLERQRDHALFVAFAPVEDPKIAVAVIVENGEKSSKAARVARRVIDRYLAIEAELELKQELKQEVTGQAATVGRLVNTPTAPAPINPRRSYPGSQGQQDT